MFVNPSTLTSMELRSLVAIYKSGKKLMFSSGHIFTKDMVINWKVLQDLTKFGLVNHINGNVILTSAGENIARRFVDRIILGYD